MGLSGAGKTTLGKHLHQHLVNSGKQSEFIDGDLVREFFDADYGYSRTERIAVTKRIAFAAHLLSNNGIQVVVANIAPYHEIQKFVAKKLHSALHLIYLKSDIEQLKQRDVKGLYAKFASGAEKSVVGLDEPFEAPENPELIVNTSLESFDRSWEAVRLFADHILKRNK